MPRRKLSTLARWSNERTSQLRQNVLAWNAIGPMTAPRTRQRVYTISEVASALGLSKEAVRTWVIEGKLKATMRGLTYVIRRTNLSRWLDKWGRTPQGARHIATLATPKADDTGLNQDDTGNGPDDTGSPPSPLPPSETLRHVNVTRYSTYMTPWHRVTLEQHCARLGAHVSPIVRDWIELYGTGIDDGY